MLAREDAWPDGLTVDAEGGIWLALNGSGRVVRFDPVNADITEEVLVEPRQSTACTFGGLDLDTLYVTTSRENLPDDADPRRLGVCRGPRRPGLPPLEFGG